MSSTRPVVHGSPECGAWQREPVVGVRLYPDGRPSAQRGDSGAGRPPLAPSRAWRTKRDTARAAPARQPPAIRHAGPTWRRGRHYDRPRPLPRLPRRSRGSCIATSGHPCRRPPDAPARSAAPSSDTAVGEGKSAPRWEEGKCYPTEGGDRTACAGAGAATAAGAGAAPAASAATAKNRPFATVWW